MSGFSHLTQCKEQEYTRNKALEISVLKWLKLIFWDHRVNNFVSTSDIMSNFVLFFFNFSGIIQKFGGMMR